MKRITIYDTTLRDGMQGSNITYTLDEKILIAKKLDEMEIDYIEGGFPLANEKEAAFFKQIKKANLHHAKVVSFGSTRKPKGNAKKDPQIQALLEADTPTVIIVGKTWKEHVKYVLQTSYAENLEMIYDSIAVLKAEGREVFFDPEHFFDGYKDDPEYAIQVLKTGSEAGADVIILCDTNGGTLPSEVTRIMNELPQNELKPLGGHFHNDSGTAVANSLAAIGAGAVQVQGTVNGWGERTGNANLCVLIPNICLKTNYEANACKNLKHLTSLSRFVAEVANIIPDKRMPYVGEASFSHKAGQHVDVLNKAAHLMEHIDGGLVGNERKILLSELAGKSTIVRKLSKYGEFDKSSPVVKELITELKKAENKGYEYEAAEASFDLIIRKALKKYTPLLELNNYHLESYKTGETNAKTVGRLFLKVKDKEVMGAAVGVGPVETLDKAIRDAIVPFYPFINTIKLTDYRVRVLNPESATEAKVRVFITSSDGQISWDTVGVSRNIVEASWQALVDSMEFYYNNYILK
ncbi:MAG: citramalate synthase [Spirochaetales bacterium]|nr:citramalate synthase [Spirochaetales bacterium]